MYSAETDMWSPTQHSSRRGRSYLRSGSPSLETSCLCRCSRIFWEARIEAGTFVDWGLQLRDVRHPPKARARRLRDCHPEVPDGDADLDLDERITVNARDSSSGSRSRDTQWFRTTFPTTLRSANGTREHGTQRLTSSWACRDTPEVG